MEDGRLIQVNVSDGGVPKLPVDAARITRGGVAYLAHIGGFAAGVVAGLMFRALPSRRPRYG